jgi:hypothetical protein
VSRVESAFVTHLGHGIQALRCNAPPGLPPGDDRCVSSAHVRKPPRTTAQSEAIVDPGTRYALFHQHACLHPSPTAGNLLTIFVRPSPATSFEASRLTAHVRQHDLTLSSRPRLDPYAPRRHVITDPWVPLPACSIFPHLFSPAFCIAGRHATQRAMMLFSLLLETARPDLRGYLLAPWGFSISTCATARHGARRTLTPLVPWKGSPSLRPPAAVLSRTDGVV